MSKKFEVASIRLKIDGKGSDIPKMAVTPAEVVLLRKAFNEIAGGEAISHVVVYGQSTLTPAQEASRLRNAYGSLKAKSGHGEQGSKTVMESCFPGDTPSMPFTFAELTPTLEYTKGSGQKPTNHNPYPDEERESLDGGLTWVEGALKPVEDKDPDEEAIAATVAAQAKKK